MKYLLTLSLILATLVMRAQQTPTETAVVAAEKARFDAQVAKDYAALDRLLADDLVYTHSNGNVDSKASFIQAIKEGKSSYNQVDVQEQKVRVYGKTAVINGVCLIKMTGANGQPTDLKLRYTDVYIKQQGTWQLATWQSLRMVP